MSKQPRAMFKRLKSAIAECHVDPKVKEKYQVTQALFGSTEEYLLTRANEALGAATQAAFENDDDEFEKNMILITRLVNIARVKRKDKNEEAKAQSEGTAGTPHPNQDNRGA